MKIDKHARYFQWRIQGLVWAYSFLGSKSQKAARLRSLGYRETAPEKNCHIYIQRVV